MRNLFGAYDSTHKCYKQIDVCVQNLYENNSLDMRQRWSGTDYNNWESLQYFLVDSRSILLLNNVNVYNNINVQKLLLIERIMYISSEMKEIEEWLFDEAKRLYAYIDTIVHENRTQHADVFNIWGRMTSDAVRNGRNLDIGELHNFAEVYGRNLESMENVIEQIQMSIKDGREFETRRDTGVGPVIKTDEHANQLRVAIIQVGFDTMTRCTREVG